MRSSSPPIIRADGVDWPLTTFLDAYRMRLVEAFDPPYFAQPDAVRLVTVSIDGEVLPPRYANEIIWQSTLAFAPIAGTPEGEPCRLCGEPVLRTDDDCCEACEDDADPWGW